MPDKGVSRVLTAEVGGSSSTAFLISFYSSTVRCDLGWLTLS